ncbi:MAG: hypothetical protein LBE91_14740 [Tannerella sp.]|jgi:hypothetical protein|nr:hypothetical protein [Tannerella sp.]
MNVLLRRRQFLGIKMVTVTFNGNGGVLQSGDEQVKVPQGTLWKNVPKPVYSIGGGATKQGGFTLVQNDDNTVIADTDAVVSDMTVFASFTVVEIGVITHLGEILSAQGWIDKYGDSMFTWTGSYWIQNSAVSRDNLIEFIYFKLSDTKAFALMSDANILYFRDQAGKGGNIGPGGTDWWQYMNSYNGFDAPRFDDTAPVNGDGTVIPATEFAHPLSYDPPYPFTENTKPLNTAKLECLRNYDEGKKWFDTMRGALAGVTGANNTTGTPVLDAIASFTNGMQIMPGDFRLASPYELSIICSDSSKQKVRNLLNTLTDWKSVNATPNRLSNRYFGWTYRGSDTSYGWGTPRVDFNTHFTIYNKSSQDMGYYLISTLLICGSSWVMQSSNSTRQQYQWTRDHIYGDVLACWNFLTNDWARSFDRVDGTVTSPLQDTLRKSDGFLFTPNNGDFLSVVADVIHLF